MRNFPKNNRLQGHIKDSCGVPLLQSGLFDQTSFRPLMRLRENVTRPKFIAQPPVRMHDHHGRLNLSLRRAGTAVAFRARDAASE